MEKNKFSFHEVLEKSTSPYSLEANRLVVIFTINNCRIYEFMLKIKGKSVL